MQRSGQRSAAEGFRTSYWEPGMGYNATMKNEGKVCGWERQIGRVELYVSGMRGAPAKPQPNLGSEGAVRRPMSAIASIRGGGAGAAQAVRPPTHLTRRAHRGIMPVKHVQTTSMDKQLSREAWAARPVRI